MTDKKDQRVKDFHGDLGLYRLLSTEDGTTTLHSNYFDEACHSLSGAMDETIYNYIQGCGIPDTLDRENVNIFETGFGIGIGYQATVHFLEKNNYNGHLTFTSTELDKALISFASEETKINSCLYPDFSDLSFHENPVPHFKATKNGHTLVILIGNARKTTPKAISSGMIEPVHAIYQDPFSPKRNPALWTIEWFEVLKSLSDREVILSTYSSSNSIRKSMIVAGWQVSNRKGFGTKRTATRAKLTGTSEETLLESLDRSPVSAIYDKDLPKNTFM